MINKQLFTEWVQTAQKFPEDFVVSLIQMIIENASSDSVSDLHFQPDQTGIGIWYRFNGVLQDLGHLESTYTNQLIARLKVLANLLTYQTTLPQEGRIQAGRVPGVKKEMRISTMPTLFGERVVVRFFAEEDKFRFPDQLGLDPDLLNDLMRTIHQNGGAIIICGPAGSGKTTTAYSLLRYLALRGEILRSIITLEDPIEHPIPRTAQIEVDSRTSFSLPEMIKYTMRQDPEVLLVGEIRDSATALAAFQAALTGHLLITTFHAGSAVEAIGRLIEMGIEPFVLRSSIHAVVCQRLFRRLCTCSVRSQDPLVLTLNERSFELNDYHLPTSCPLCSHTGYLDRIVVAESLPLQDPRFARSILGRIDTVSLQKKAVEIGMKTLVESAIDLVRAGVTSPLEVQRVLGMEIAS